MWNRKTKQTKIIILIACILAVACVGVYFFVKYQTYDYIEITSTYENSSTDNANYRYCESGIIRYSRDGIALLNVQGEERWNQPCQMSNPMIDFKGDSIAIADKGGTSIFVFEEKGLKGEIQTTRPIEKISVSGQGVVSAILKDEQTPLVMCYDAKGKVLVEHKISIGTMGYPIDVALSEDGNTLLVSYLFTQGNSIVSKVAYYYFGDDNTGKENHLVYQTDLDDTIIPATSFLQRDISLLVADDALLLYKGLKDPKETVRIELKQEIQSLEYSDELIAVLVRNDKSGDYKLNVYNTKGKQVMSVGVDKQYTEIRILDDKILLFDDQSCGIYMKNGICKYEGNMDENILEIFPIGGFNKYMVINASGFHEVELAK